MIRFFKRIGALILSGSFLGTTLFLVLQLQPQSPGAWALFAVLLLSSLGGTLLVYRLFMGAHFQSPYPDPDRGEGLAPGLALGAVADRRRDDGDASHGWPFGGPGDRGADGGGGADGDP